MESENECGTIKYQEIAFDKGGKDIEMWGLLLNWGRGVSKGSKGNCF